MQMKLIVLSVFLIPTGATVLRSSRSADVNGTDAAVQRAPRGADVHTGAWDGTGVLGSDRANQCLWRTHTSGVFLNGGAAPKLCLRPYSDMVSDYIKRDGFWGDCPKLAELWTSLPAQNAGEKLYVDVGTNIGACLLPMTARPDVTKALAFEPALPNLFYLTSTLLANPTSKAKVTLYPFALGSESKMKPMYEEAGNAGNTVVGERIGAVTNQVGQVEIETLDDVLLAGGAKPYVHLMKLDAQGYEVKILQGGAKLFSSGAVNAVKFELAGGWLEKQGTSSAEYLNTFLNYGFQVYDVGSKLRISQAVLHNAACGTAQLEFLAIHLKAGEAASQTPVVC